MLCLESVGTIPSPPGTLVPPATRQPSMDQARPTHTLEANLLYLQSTD